MCFERPTNICTHTHYLYKRSALQNLNPPLGPEGRIFCFSWSHHVVCGILAPQPGMEPVPPVVEAWCPNHWTAREFSGVSFLSTVQTELFLICLFFFCSSCLQQDSEDSEPVYSKKHGACWEHRGWPVMEQAVGRGYVVLLILSSPSTCSRESMTENTPDPWSKHSTATVFLIGQLSSSCSVPSSPTDFCAGFSTRAGSCPSNR